MKQVVISMVIVMVAAGILAGMVLYTVSVLRMVQSQILTGEYLSAEALPKENYQAVYWQ